MSEIENTYNQIDKDAKIVVICHHGMRSLQVGAYLEGLGYKNITNLEGGIDQWARDVEHDMPTY